jgi:hypothetical protein
MKKARAATADDDRRTEYDFTGAVRGKYYERYRASSNVVVLDPDVSEAFVNADEVNKALRLLVSVARKRVSVKTSSRAKERPNKRMQQTAPEKSKRRS